MIKFGGKVKVKYNIYHNIKQAHMKGRENKANVKVISTFNFGYGSDDGWKRRKHV